MIESLSKSTFLEKSLPIVVRESSALSEFKLVTLVKA